MSVVGDDGQDGTSPFIQSHKSMSSFVTCSYPSVGLELFCLRACSLVGFFFLVCVHCFLFFCFFKVNLFHSVCVTGLIKWCYKPNTAQLPLKENGTANGSVNVTPTHTHTLYVGYVKSAVSHWDFKVLISCIIVSKHRLNSFVCIISSMFIYTWFFFLFFFWRNYFSIAKFGLESVWNGLNSYVLFL